VLLGQSGREACQIADVILQSRRHQLYITLENRGIHFPTFNELVNVLGGKEVLTKGSVFLQGKNGFVDARLNGNLDLQIVPNRRIPRRIPTERA
jgi:hypothetical protein